MPLLRRAQNSPMFDVWMQSIRSKITGDADTVLELYGTPLDWDDIKTNLISHYSDKRNEVSLTRDLFQLSQTTTVVSLYESVRHIISLLVNQLNLNERDIIRHINKFSHHDYQSRSLEESLRVKKYLFLNL